MDIGSEISDILHYSYLIIVGVGILAAYIIPPLLIGSAIYKSITSRMKIGDELEVIALSAYILVFTIAICLSVATGFPDGEPTLELLRHAKTIVKSNCIGLLAYGVLCGLVWFIQLLWSMARRISHQQPYPEQVPSPQVHERWDAK